ncbi:DNA repair protein Rad4 [Ancylostoma duodenale]|uniref:DNA repair protein Rad4 n=1 Tax=Ancylostoma duodenale TaxID=51022 RepID=A0A0C2D7D3_9BILA|nr:DNA repair protein Rad4 [Ancylostoma duodenale]
MVATRSSSRSANASQQKAAMPKEDTSVKIKGSKRSKAAKPSLSSQKIKKKTVTRRRNRLSVEGDPEVEINEDAQDVRSLSKNPNGDEPVPVKRPRKSQKMDDEQEEEKQSLKNQDEWDGKTEAPNESVPKLEIKTKEEEDTDQWEDFGNTSEEEAAENNLQAGKKKQNKKGKKTLKAKVQKPKEKESVLRRSNRKVIRKELATKIQGLEGSSSSSSADSESDESAGVGNWEPKANPRRKTMLPMTVMRALKLCAQKNLKGLKVHGNLVEILRASKGSPKTSVGSTRANASKPPKPWQRTEQPVVEGDIVVPPRALRRGERKMLKFRIFAASLALGRNYEMTLEEGCKIVEEMNAQSAANQKAVSSALGLPQDIPEEDKSSSEDEWEEMVPVDIDESNAKDVQVTLKEKGEKDWWAIYLRQEVNKCVRENWENAHKVNILCYIGHLQYLRKVALEENLVPSLMLTTIPSGYQSLVGEPLSIENARRMTKWYHSAFKPSGAPIKYEAGTCRFDATARLSEMVSQQVFENDADRAVNVIKQITKMKEGCGTSSNPPSEKQKSKESTKEKIRQLPITEECLIDLGVDPLRATVDEPNSIEENLTKPVIYVFAIDNEGGVRDVTARYASDFLRPEFRRSRTEQKWIVDTLKKRIIRANRERSEQEDLHMRQELVNKPLPTTLSEYKNHPLYVLEKDLLKFEGIYPKPEDQKPLGEVRGHKVYPRSTVYTLQSDKNWIKMARSVKEGEKPYKVVKARANPRIPAEEREQRYLDVFGYWQTEPFRPPKVVDGRIPCNEFGNVYMYQPSMCPIGAVHLRLPGLPSIARRLGGLECVPAVVGWEFNSCSNFPIIEGACVLEKDAPLFVNEWKRLEATREERENKKREERVLGNWRKLIRGILRLHYVKSKFGATKEKAKSKKKKESVADKEENDVVIDRTVMAPRQVFTHDDLMKL